MRFWVLAGTEDNWLKAISENIWGIREGLKSRWDKLEKGDILLFYSTSPISGIIGVGEVESKFKQDKPLWTDEIKKNKVIWPYRFDFKVHYALPKLNWKDKNVKISDLRLNFRAGINPVTNKEAVKSFFRRADSLWNTELSKLVEEMKIPIKIPVKRGINIHDEIKDELLQLGKIERYISEKEYVIPDLNERLDVVWRKLAASVPTYVFEVQIGGNVHQALSKLKHAYDIWNSNIFLVIREEDKNKVEQLIGGTFHEIRERLKIITVSKMKKIYELQMEDHKLKREVGLR